jgi:predicted permease
MSSLLPDLKLALRSCARRPGATALIVVSLAVTVGISAGAFSVLDAVVWRALPVRAPSELVSIWARDRQQRIDQMTWTEIQAISSRVPGLSDVIGQSRHTANVDVQDHREYPLIAATSDNYFDALGVGAALGTVYRRGAGRDGEIVISHSYWQRALGGDPGALARPLRVNNVELRVLGVLPVGFGGANRGLAVELFVPVQTAFGVLRFGHLEDRTNNDFEVLGRMKPGVAATAIRRDVEAALRHVDAEGASPGPGRTAYVERLDGSDDPRAGAVSILFGGIVLLVLLVAAANVANMRLAQNEERRGETAIRLALGASRLALWRQHLAEMAVLAGAGLVFSVVVSSWLVDLAPRMLFANDRFVDYFIRLDVRTWAFSLAAMLLVTLVGTALPFRDAGRTQVSPNLAARGATRTSRWLPALVVGQIAMVTGIVCVAGLLWQSMVNLSAIRPAMDPDRSLVLVSGFWNTDKEVTPGVDRMFRRLSALPGVRSVAFARRAMLSGSGGGAAVPVEFAGRPALSFRYNQVSPGYFSTTGARVLRGRVFTDGDSASSTPVMMINESFAGRFFRDRDPVGQWVRAAGAERQIVGVVEDGPTNHLREARDPYLYLPFAQRPSSDVTWFVEVAGRPGAGLDQIRRQSHAVDPAFQLFTIQTLADHMKAARAEDTLAAALAGGLAGLGLLLAAAGLFGVTLFAVGRRMQEFGVRVALGATARTLAAQVVRDSWTLVVLGLAVGTGIGAGGHALVRSELYGVSSWDVTSLIGAVTVVVLVSLVATLQPAIRAARVDPVVALRQD